MKLDIDYFAVQIMWLVLFLRITAVNEITWLLIELMGCLFCTGYVIKNIKCINRSTLIWGGVLAFSYLISSAVNRQYNGLYVTFSGVIYACKMILYIAVPWISVKKRGSRKITKVSRDCLLLYWVPSVITVLIQGRNVVDNANNIYFIGNKFNVAYLNVILLCFNLYLMRRDNNERQRFVLSLKIRHSSVLNGLFYFLIIYLDLYMKAYTGLFMIIFVLLLSFISRLFKFKINRRWTGFLNFISSPIVLVVSVILSGIVTVALDAIMSLPTIATYLGTIGKTGNILSRTLIYKNLGEIISKKPWIGYGYGTAVVSRYFGPNAQNGLAQVAIQAGIIGVVLMLLITYHCGKMGKNSGGRTAPFLFGVYAFILSATVEITLGGSFLILLAFYCVCGWERKVKGET